MQMITLLLLGALSGPGQRRTIADMRTIWTAVSSYRQDHGAFPPATSIDDLAPFVSPTYIAHLPKTDAQGRTFVYETDATRQHVRLSTPAALLEDGVVVEPMSAPAEIAAVVRDARGHPLPGVTVTLTSSDGTKTRVVTPVDGSAHFPISTTGDCALDAELSGFYSVSLARIPVIAQVRGSDNPQPLDITMTPQPNICRGGIRGEVRQAVLTTRVEPVCEGANGDPSVESVLELQIGKTGSVEDVKVVQGPITGYTRAAERALHGWHFERATLNMQPVSVLLYVRVQGCWISEPLSKAPRSAD